MSENIEHCIIGAIIQKDRELEIAVECGLTAESFSDEICRKIFTCMLETKQFDEVTLYERLKDTIPGNAIMQMETAVASHAHFRDWCTALKRAEIKKRMTDSFAKATEELNRGDDIEKVLGNIRKMEIVSEDELRHGVTLSLDDLSRQVIEHIYSGDDSLPFFAEGTAARQCVVLRKHQVFVVAGMSGTGKTEFALSASVLPCLTAGKRVLYICTESTADEIWGRFAGIIAGSPYKFAINKHCTEEEIKSFGASMKSSTDRFKNLLSIRGNESKIFRSADVRSCIRRAEAEGPIDLVVIDYLQDLRSDNRKFDGDIYNTTSEVMSDLKTLVDEHGFGMLVLSQLNRTNDRTTGKPNLYRLKGSGNIEQTAHVVAFLWRDEEKKRTLFFSGKTRLIEPFEYTLNFDRYGYSVQGHKYSAADVPEQGRGQK